MLDADAFSGSCVAMTKPALLVHPSLGLFELRLTDYEVVHWPTERRDIRAAVTIGPPTSHARCRA